MSEKNYNAINSKIEKMFNCFAEVAIPGAHPEVLTYGIPTEYLPDCKPGSLVQITLRNKNHFGMVMRIFTETPEFKVLALTLHASHYQFEKDYLKLLSWCSERFLCNVNQTLSVFWPNNLEKIFDYPKNKGIEFSEPKQSILPDLNQEQTKAFHQIHPALNQRQFAPFLIHGITGSGKTRLYLELISECISKKKQALLLVPEIGLTPQIFSYFTQNLSARIGLIHSNLGEKQKRETWYSIFQNKIDLLIGTRSALFAPLKNLGLIIVDEEHDSSFKQQDPPPRYHVRDVVLYYASLKKIPVCLGSATPSIESYELGLQGKLELISLKTRVLGLQLPKTQIVNMREQYKLQGDRSLSFTLREALESTIQNEKQAILLINRRGYSTSRLCAECGEVDQCLFCNISLVFHKKSNSLECHQCGKSYPTSKPCKACNSRDFIYQGKAIEQIEEELIAWIPHVKILRMDRDTTSRKGSMEKMLKSFREGEFQILLGTQMVAKGHDFPRVDLVGILSADIGMNQPDYRASEKTFQLITQTAGRAGRSSGQGVVYIQTFQPENPVIQFATQQNYLDFFYWEKKQREELNYPPFKRLLLLELQHHNPERLSQAIKDLEFFLKSPHIPKEILILGPTQPTQIKIQGRYCSRYLFKGAGNQLRWLLTQPQDLFKKLLAKKIKVRIDPDP